MDFLNVSHISFQREQSAILHDIHFVLPAFDKLAICGETGSGKSTLLKIISGHIQPASGDVFFRGARVKGPEEVLIPGHPGIAYLSQHFELRNNYRVEELLAMANKLPGSSARSVYEICRVNHLLQRRTDQLSGGEKQRIALARLLVSNPSLLLLDEPFSNLDRIHKEILKKVIRDLENELKTTVVLTSHDPSDILSWATQIVIMKEGKILQSDSPEKIYYHPVNAYAAGILDRYIERSNALLTLFPSLAQTGSEFIRPDRFYLSPGETNAVKGRIVNVLFNGGYTTLEIQAGNILLTVNTIGFAARPGDEVFVGIRE